MRSTKRLSLEQLTPFLWDEKLLERAAGLAAAFISWRDLYGNDHPVEIEVGSGKGAFLLAAALARPEINFFGIEIVRKYQLYVATRMAIRGLRHVRVACADARVLIRDRVPPVSVQAIHVYFPDPWWKKRHHKRRLFTPEFVAACTHAIKPGGRLYIATDVADYFVLMTELCGQQPELRLLADAGPAHHLEYLTNFERKAREEGTPVNRAVYERR